MGKSKKKAKNKSQTKVKSLASKAKKKSWGKSTTKAERTERALLIPKDVQNQILNDIKKMKYITSTQLSLHYGVKISVIKPFLKELEAQNKINLVLANSRIKIYIPTKEKAKTAT
ncbi:MAG: hypothetical protein ACTSRG_03150 [Candidatus Helarchaeota archaeon]